MNYTLLNGDYFKSDNFCKLSEQARLYYIMLLLEANNGFVSNPKGILDSMNYDKSVLIELVENGDVLAKPNRDEIFITCFYVHNKGNNTYGWKNTPFAIYWKDLWVKQNRVATLKLRTKADDPEDSVQEILGIN